MQSHLQANPIRASKAVDPHAYANNPVGYARDVLRAPYIWDAQVCIAAALRTPPYKVLVKSGHKLGKTWTGGWLINWFYDSFNPSGIITIAPRYEHLVNILWKEVRLQRTAAGLSHDFIGPRAPEMRSGPDHYAIGITATRGEAVTGRHEKRILFVFDEAVGVDQVYWTTAKTMFKPDGSCGWLAFCNPTNTATAAYMEDQALKSSGEREWHVIELSCLDHPNIAAQREGRPLVVEQAVTLGMIEGWTREWCSPITFAEVGATDICWPPLEPDQPPETGTWLRPGPEFESRCLGRWPTQGSHGVWNDSLWKASTILDGAPRVHPVPLSDLPQIGCDVARFGCFDDKTEILTDSGWKLFEHLTGQEQVFTLNGDVAEWGPITEIHKYPFDGEMNLVESKRVNFCITDNHRLVVRSRNHPEWSIKRFDELPQEFIARRASGWAGTRIDTVRFRANKIMPYGGTHVREWAFDPLDWCRFLGWFVSEGCVYEENRNNGRLRILISQKSNSDKVSRIRSLLQKMGIVFRYAAGSFEFTNGQIGEHLRKHCVRGAGNKRVPEYVKNATTDQIEAFLETFCLGDGTHRDGRRLSYYTSSRLLADDIQEMLIKIGRAGKITKRHVSGSTFMIGDRAVERLNDGYVLNERSCESDLWVYKSKIKKQAYVGYVYCVSTPFQTIMVRRGGVPIWSGNSDNTAIHVRWGDTSLHHEEANGWATTQTTGRIIELARRFAEMVCTMRRAENRGPMVDEREIPIKVDDDGIGGSCTDQLQEQGYNVQPVRSGQTSNFSTRYPNKRSELWFATADRARQGRLALGRLDSDTLHRLKSQAMAPEWKPDSAGRRVVESKDITKEKIGRSPDSIDALNLAYFESTLWDAPMVLPPAADERPRAGTKEWMQEREDRPGRRKLFGR